DDPKQTRQEKHSRDSKIDQPFAWNRASNIAESTGPKLSLDHKGSRSDRLFRPDEPRNEKKRFPKKFPPNVVPCFSMNATEAGTDSNVLKISLRKTFSADHSSCSTASSNVNAYLP